LQHQELLLTFAEMAVASAGFSAVVSSFDRRSESDDPRVRHWPGTSCRVGLFFPLLQSAPYFLRIVSHGDLLEGPTG